MLIEIDPDDLYSGKIDGQGRKYLDRALAGSEVTVAIVDIKDPEAGVVNTYEDFRKTQ